MSALRRSDIWFGIIIAVFFALVAVVFFGKASVDPDFWSMFIPLLATIVTVGFMRGILADLPALPRGICWFAIGFTLAVFVTLGGGHDIDLTTTAAFGFGLAILEQVATTYFSKKDASNG